MLGFLPEEEGNDPEAFEHHYRNLFHACHVATNHEYIRIAMPGENKGSSQNLRQSCI